MTGVEHHDVFSRFVDGCRAMPNWIGVSTRREFFVEDLRFVTVTPPPPDAEYFEWIDVLEAVIQARDRFTMLELGAGYGRWIVNAAAALRSYGRLPYRLVAVEAEPTHFRWLRAHCRDNGIRRFSRRGTCRVVEAAVAPVAGRAQFLVGRPDEWYGQALAAAGGDADPVATVKTVSLSSLLRPLDLVDLIHMDVQGAEFEVLTEARDELPRVKRIHVGTHAAAIEEALRDLFGELGWASLNDYGCGTVGRTPWGTFSFQDGVQTWLNPDHAPSEGTEPER